MADAVSAPLVLPEIEHEMKLILSRLTDDKLFLVGIYAADLPPGAGTLHNPLLGLAKALQEAADAILAGELGAIQ